MTHRGVIDTLLNTHRDRLARFGVDLIELMLEDHRLKLITLLDDVNKTPQEELVTDMMALIASFSGRVYSPRAAALERL